MILPCSLPSPDWTKPEAVDSYQVNCHDRGNRTGQLIRELVKRYAQVAGLLLATVFVAIQFVPVERVNHVGAGDPDAPRDVQWILRRACYDCHSGETRWPIWAYVAPFSWQVVRDVNRAREILNFSDWAAYDAGRRVALRALVGPVTSVHRMPLWYYLTLHPDSRLSNTDLAALAAWSQGASNEVDIE